MKTPILSLALILFCIININAQTTLYLRPNAVTGKDAYTNSVFSTTNYGSSQSLIIADAPVSGSNSKYKSLLAFDLSSIPLASTITSAQLSLYNDSTSSFNGGQHATTGGFNSFKIWRLTGTWQESTLTYNTSLGFTSANSVIVPTSTSNNQNFVNINVQAMVNDMIHNPSTSYGFYMELVSVVASPLRCVVLASSDHPDSTKRPLLVLTYNSCYAAITAGGPVTFCPGGSVILTANSGISYQWKLNGANITGATSQNYTATTGGNYTVVVNTGNCTTTSSATTVTVSNAAITPNGPVAFCTGGSVVLTTTSGTSYQWKLNGANITGATLQNYTATTGGSYTVVVTTSACTATSSPIVVTVNNSPTASITASGATTFCAPGSVLLNATTGTGYTYLWKKDNVTISGATASAYTASVTGSYTVIVTVPGCSSTSSPIQVTAILEIAAIFANGSYTGIACINGGTTFSASTGTGYTYQWKLNGNNITGATASTYSTSAAGTYTCQITSGTCSKLSNSINAQQQTSVTNVNGPTTFCTSGPSLTTTTNIGSSLTYQWQNNNVNITGATNWTYSPTASGSYRCVVTSAGFCNASTYSNPVTIQAGVAPQISIASSNGQWPVSICTQQPVDLLMVDASTGAVWTGGSGIQWSRNGDPIVDGSGWGNMLLGVLESGLYNVSLTTNCGTSLPPSMIPVSNINSAYINVTGSTCAPTLSLEPNSISFAPYQWYAGATPITGANFSTYTPTVGGNYSCQISNACGSNIIGTTYVVPNTPNPVITPAGPTTNCGGSVVLNANGSGWTYWWKKNGVTIAGATGPSYTATSNGTYSVEAGTSGNCYATSATVQVTVATPVTTITAGGATTFCSGSVVLSATSLAGQTYQWQKNSINISGATSSAYSANASGTYTCVITNGCGVVTSNPIYVNVIGVPAIPGTITATGGNTKVCPGNVKTYSIAAVTGATSYNWIPPAGGVVTSGQGTISATITYNSGLIPSDSLRITSVNTCGSSYHRALSIKRNDPATPGSITGSTYGLCNLTGVPYSVTNVSGMTYNWSFAGSPGTVTNGQGTNAITVNYTPGNFSDSLKVTASNACGISGVRKISIRAIPATPASITGITAVCANQQNVPYSIGAIASSINYTWTGPTGSTISDGINTSVLGVLTTTATSVTVNYASSGGTLKVKANNNCGSGSNKSVTITIVCREAQLLADADFTIQPNPASGDAKIIVSNFSGQKNETVIRDMEGRIVFTASFETEELIVPADAFSAGIYFVEVRNETAFKIMRLVKTGF